MRIFEFFAVFLTVFLLNASSEARISAPKVSNGKCATPEGTFHEAVCSPTYGFRTKEDVAPFATGSTVSEICYNKCSGPVDCTANDDGVPQWSLKAKGSPAAARGANTRGAGDNATVAVLRAFGDDPAGGNGERQAAYPAIMAKGMDPCKWWMEVAHLVTATAAGGASNPSSVSFGGPRATRLYGAVPSIVLRPSVVQQPHPKAMASTYDGSEEPIGATTAKVLARSTLNPHADRYNQLKDGTCRGVSSFSDKDTPCNDRPPITLAENRLFQETAPYAIYDPSSTDLEEERLMALDLYAKTPTEVAQIKREKSGGWLDAFAARSPQSGDLTGILSRLRPTTHMDSGFRAQGGKIAEKINMGMPRDSLISTPLAQFKPGIAKQLIDQYPQLQDTMNNLAGKSLGTMMVQALMPKGNDKISNSELFKCLSAMKAIGGGDERLRNPILAAQHLNASCRTDFLATLQAQGGMSLEALNQTFQLMNNPTHSLHLNGKKIADVKMNDFNLDDLPVSAKQIADGQLSFGPFKASTITESLFKGNKSKTFDSFAAGSLNMGGAGHLNDILMQRAAPNMPKIGALKGNIDGRFFGKDNVKQMPVTLAQYKQTPYLQIFHGSHTFDRRAFENMFPERDHYSPCAHEKTCYVSKNEAEFSFFTPWYKGNSSRADLKHDSDIKTASLAPDLHSPESLLPDTELPDTIQDTLAQLKNFYVPYFKSAEANDPNSPLYFGPYPTHLATGMPKTTIETGALIFRDDGTVYYENMPLKKINFIAKRYYTKEDVDKGYLPKHFAAYVPDNMESRWDRLAMSISQNGGIGFMPPEKLEEMVAKINKTFRDMGSTSRVNVNMFRQAADDYATLIRREYARLNRTTGSELASTSRIKNPISPKLFESLGISSANASPIISVASPVRTPISRAKDIVRCAGKRNHNQIRVDVLQTRYDRFNHHALMRILYNRYAMADHKDPARCTPFGKVCAPKPCPGGISAWSKSCWKVTHQPLNPLCYFPAIKAGPSDEFPLAAVRWDYGKNINDIAYHRPINNICGRKTTGLFQKARANCEFNANICKQTKAYNCRIFEAQTFCGYSWAYHAELKYILHKWAEESDGDFVTDAGENYMKHECEALAEDIVIGNKLELCSMKAADYASTQIPEGSSFPEYFGVRRPYVVDDATGVAYGRSPGQPLNLNNTDGAFVFACTSSGVAKELDDYATFTPMQGRPQTLLANVLSDTTQAAHAFAARGHQASKMPATTGLGGGCAPENGICPKANGLDPMTAQLGQLIEQAKAVHRYGLLGLVNDRIKHQDGVVAMYAQMCGATVSVKTEAGNRSVLYTQPGTNNIEHPEGFNGTAGSEPMEEKVGGDEALKLGTKAGCSLIVMKNGFGGEKPTGPESKSTRLSAGVITSVNESKGFITAYFKVSDGVVDINGQPFADGRFERLLYAPGKMPEDSKAILVKKYGPDSYYCYKIRTGQDRECEMTEKAWKESLHIFYRKNDEQDEPNKDN